MDITQIANAAPPASAFDSTDAGVVIALRNLQPIGRTVLTFLAIDPSLVRGVERDRLRTLVKLVIGNPSNELIGMALNDLRKMWKRGLPVAAFDDASAFGVDVDRARTLLADLRARYETRWESDTWEEKHIQRVLVLCGYDRAGEFP